MRLPGPQARSLCGACSWKVVYLVHRRSLPAPHSLFSGDKQVNVLWRAQHLCRPLNTNHGSQPLGIILGIEHGAGPRGLLSSTGGSQHITDFTVEVRVCWQFVEYEVPDAFYCVPVREGGGMKRPAELCYQWLHRDVAQYVARCLGWKSEHRPWTQTIDRRPPWSQRVYFYGNIINFLMLSLR